LNQHRRKLISHYRFQHSVSNGYLLHAGFFLSSSTLKMTGMFLKRRLTFTELRPFLSLKMELYIITAVRTSDPTSFSVDLQHELFLVPSFIKIGSSIQKLMGRGETQTHRQHDDFINLPFIFSK
jgi:hypothetical protein